MPSDKRLVSLWRTESIRFVPLYNLFTFILSAITVPMFIWDASFIKGRTTSMAVDLFPGAHAWWATCFTVVATLTLYGLLSSRTNTWRAGLVVDGTIWLWWVGALSLTGTWVVAPTALLVTIARSFTSFMVAAWMIDPRSQQTLHSAVKEFNGGTI